MKHCFINLTFALLTNAPCVGSLLDVANSMATHMQMDQMRDPSNGFVGSQWFAQLDENVQQKLEQAKIVLFFKIPPKDLAKDSPRAWFKMTDDLAIYIEDIIQSEVKHLFTLVLNPKRLSVETLNEQIHDSLKPIYGEMRFADIFNGPPEQVSDQLPKNTSVFRTVTFNNPASFLSALRTVRYLLEQLERNSHHPEESKVDAHQRVQ